MQMSEDSSPFNNFLCASNYKKETKKREISVPDADLSEFYDPNVGDVRDSEFEEVVVKILKMLIES